jgi:hypothetical protein
VTRWVIARLLGGVAIVLATIVLCSALIAVLDPRQSPRPGVWAGTVEGVRMRLLHGDFGISGVEPGAVPVTTLFTRGVAVDAVLVVVLGLLADVATVLLDPRIDVRSD